MSEELNLTEILKNISKKYGDGIVHQSVEEMPEFGSLSFGSPSADYCIYNSFPEGRIIEFSGNEGSGKTSSAILLAANYQKKELERNPDNPRKILFVDNEGTFDAVWAKKLGYDTSEEAPVGTIYLTPLGQPDAVVFNWILDFIKSGEIGLIILDSIATLVPSQVVDESVDKQQMGGIAKTLTSFTSRAIGLLKKYRTTLIGINQTRDNLSGYGDPVLTPGGRAWKHACSMRIMFKRGKFFDENGNELAKKDANSPAGNWVELYVLKTKSCKWDRKVGRYTLNYTRGVDILQDTIDTAILMGYIDNSTQGSYKLLNPDTKKPLLDEDGKEIKIRGKGNVKPYFEEHKDVWKKLYDKLYEQMSIKDDPYSKTFEEMLGIDLEEELGFKIEEEQD